MKRLTRIVSLTLVGLVLCLGCAQPGTSKGSDGAPAATTGPKRLTAAIRGNPHTVYQKLNPRSNIPGIDALQLLVNTGMSVPDPTGEKRVARLAEQAPTVENGLWKLNPDGTMEVTWTIKQGAVWHDGTPLTADDLVFTTELWQDKRLPVLAHQALASVASVDVINPRTVSVKWSKPYIGANDMFSTGSSGGGGGFAYPVAKHKLAEAYQTMTDQEQFIGNPYWSTEFVGLGPYKIKSWEPGAFLTVSANDQYIMGRPKIDEVTVKFIPDPNTLGANILAGEVDVPWGGRIDLEWAQTVTDQWRAGKLATELTSMLQIYPQHLSPTPAIVLNTDFKRAMVHALDRQTMGDELNWPGSPIGHSFVSPNEPEYPFVESAIVKYDYDPRKSLTILEGLGYTKQSDGFLHDASGAKLAFQIRTSQGDVTQEKAMYASADAWQKLGVEIDRHLVVPQRAGDAEYRATYPAFDLKRQAGTFDYARSYHTRGIARPENNFLASGNNSRYSRPEMDAAIDKYFTTIPWTERMEVGKQIVNMLSSDVGWIGLWHLIGPNLVPDRVTGMPSTNTDGIQYIHEWDLK